MTEAEELELLELEAEAAASGKAKAPTLPAYLGAVPAQSTAPKPQVSAALQKLVGKGGLAGLVAGAAEEGTALASGAKQLYQNFAGDEASQQAARDEEKQRLALFEELYQGDKPVSATAGGIIPSLMPVTGGVGTAVRAAKAAKGAAKIPAVVAGLVGRAGSAAGRGGGVANAVGSMAGGALGGAVAPTTEEGQRSNNVTLGLGLGALFPAASGATEALRRVNRTIPDEARDDLVRRLGFSGNRSEASAKLRAALNADEKVARTASDARYQQVKDIAKGTPPQSLDAAHAALGGVKSFADQIKAKTYPKLHKILSFVGDEAGPKPSAIANPAGGQFMLPPAKYTYDEIDDVRKELSRLKRELYDPQNKGKTKPITDAIAAIDDDMQKFDPAIGPGVSAARAGASRKYAEEVVPFDEGDLGKFRRGDVMEPNQLGTPEETANAMRMAPSSRRPMRELAGERVAEGKPLSFAESLTPDERDYASRILRGESKNTPWPLSWIPGDWDKRYFGGVDPLGYKKRYSSFLRSAALPGAGTYQLSSQNNEE